MRYAGSETHCFSAEFFIKRWKKELIDIYTDELLKDDEQLRACLVRHTIQSCCCADISDVISNVFMNDIAACAISEVVIKVMKTDATADAFFNFFDSITMVNKESHERDVHNLGFEFVAEFYKNEKGLSIPLPHVFAFRYKENGGIEKIQPVLATAFTEVISSPLAKETTVGIRTYILPDKYKKWGI